MKIRIIGLTLFCILAAACAEPITQPGKLDGCCDPGANFYICQSQGISC